MERTDSLWESVKGFQCVRAGKFPEDCSSAVMVYATPYIYQLRWKNLERYAPKRDEWYSYPGIAVLPEITGLGAGIAYDGKEFLYITRGGRLTEFYRYEIKTGKIEELASLSYYKPIGLGGCLAYGEGYVYCLRGDNSPDFFRYDIKIDRWKELPPINATSSLYIGAQCTGVVYIDKSLLAWPDHHVRRFDTLRGEWDKGCFAVTFRPSVNGGMFAYEEKEEKVYIVQGNCSMTIGRLDLKTKRFSYLSPRLPDVVSVPGNRLVIAEVEGKRYLYLYRGHATHEFWRIKISSLKEIAAI